MNSNVYTFDNIVSQEGAMNGRMIAKRFLVMVAAFMVLLTSVAAGGQAEQGSKKPMEGEPIELVSTTANLIGASTQRLQVNISKTFEEKGKGLFKFNHYDSATLFKTDAEFGAVYDGDVDMAFLQAAFFFDNGAKWANMLDIGYLFTSVDHMKAVFNPETEVGAWMQQKLWDQFHIKTFGAFFLGTRDVWLREKGKVVNVPEDLKGVKLRMPNSASFLMLGQALGANPTPLNGSEVYLAMKTGTIDAQENIYLSSYAQGQQELCSSIVLTSHMLTANFICMNGDTWESMSVEQQKLFEELIKEAALANDKEIIAEQERIKKECVDKYGMTLQYPDKEKFREHVLDFYLAIPANQANWNMDMLDKINEMAKQY